MNTLISYHSTHLKGFLILFFFDGLSAKPRRSKETSTDHLFYDSEVAVLRISVHTRSGDEVDFIRKDSSWVNKDNQAMNTSFAEEMLHALVSVSFEPVRKSQEATARQALRDKGLQVTVHWADGTQKTFYLVTAFDSSKTFVCFSSDSTMTGPCIRPGCRI